MKSHFVPPAPSARLCGGKEGKGMAAKSETALRGTAARRPASTMSSPWARRAGDVAPYHGCHGACAWVRAWRVHGAWTWCALCMMVGADVPGGPRTRVVPDVVPVGAARRGRRALPWVPWCGGAGMACAWCVDMVCIRRARLDVPRRGQRRLASCPGIAQGKFGTLSVSPGNILCPVSLGPGGKSGQAIPEKSG